MKILKTLYIVMLMMALGCNEQLDLEPISVIGENGYFNNAKEVEAALIGAYDGLQQTVQREIFILENRSDNGRVGSGSGGDFLAVTTFDDKAISSVITAYWTSVYNAISRANVVLKYVDVVEDDNLRNQIEGEARFIRAYLYFRLVRMFGEVPLVLETVNPEETAVLAKVPVNDVYQAIIEDLMFAANNLPATSTEKRAAGLPAKGILAKVHLTRQDFSLAKPLLEDIINSGSYALENSYSDVFDLGNELNDEMLFVIQFKSGSNGEGNNFSYELTPESPIGAVRPTDNLINAYNPSDQRKDVSLSETDKLILKYKNNNILYDGDNDWPVLRYADIVLMYGEVLNEQSKSTGPTQLAIDYLNLTRERAGLPILTKAEMDTYEAYKSAMLKERRLELAFENQRWFDLLRTDTALEVMRAIGANDGFEVEPYRLFFPIPQRDIDTSGGILKQNAGYQ